MIFAVYESKRKKQVELELCEVEPIVRKARESVGEIRPDSLSEIRSLRAPPPIIRDLLEGVLRLMGIYDMSWTSMKAFLGKRTIKEEIISFDAKNVTVEIRNSVQELMNQKPEAFEEVTVKRSFVAAAPLAVWVKANIQFSQVLEKIAPLENDLSKLSSSLDKSRAKLQKLLV